MSRRMRRGVVARVAKGLPGSAGGKRPYGWGVQKGTRDKTDRATGETVTVPLYDTTLPRPEEIKFIKAGAKRRLAGMSQGAVVRWLNAEGSRTTEGNPWTPKSWRNVMLNPRTAGLIEHGGELHEAVWDGALSVETWEAVKALHRESAAQRPYAGRERVHLLTGVAECYRCHRAGAEVQGCSAAACRGPHVTVRCKPSGGRNRKNTRLYFCPSCRGVGRNLALLDAYTEGRTLRLLADKRFAVELHRAIADEGGTDLQTQITALEQRRDTTREDLKNLADNPDVDATLALLSLASFDRKIEGLRSQMAVSRKLRRLTQMTGVSRKDWAAEPVDVRSAVVQDVFRVVILPTSRRGPGFDPSSVRLERQPLRG